MKNMKRILLTVVSALLLMAVTVVGTLAYLQATTKQVINTFTAGNVTLENSLGNGLDEAKTDVYGVPVVGADRVIKNEYKIIPGREYTKDPTVHVAAGSEPCYVYVKLDNQMINYLGSKTIETQMDELGWDYIEDQGVYYYNGPLATNGIVDAREALKDLVVFNTITLKGDMNDTDIADAATKQIVVQAYALQADTFTDVDEDGIIADDAYQAAPCTWPANPVEDAGEGEATA